MAASVHLLPAVFLFSVFPAVVWSRGDVLELGDADWDYLAPEHQTMLVKFYAPGCGHCKKLSPEFEKAASRLKGTVRFAKVDCTSQTETCSRFGITGFPTLKIFRNGRDSGLYDGPRTTDGISQYMKKQTGPDSVQLQTPEDLQNFVNHYDASVVGVFSGEESSGLLEFLKAAALLRDQFRFAHTTERHLGEEHGIQAEGVLLFRPPRLSSRFEDSVVVFTDYLTINSLRRFIRDHIHGLCPHMTLENKDRLRVRDLLTAFYDLDYRHNVKVSNYWRNRVMKVASQYKTAGLTFSVANKKDFLSELEDDFGLGTSDGGELPFVTIRTKLGHKFTMREEFTGGGGGVVVVAETFDKMVNDPDKDVLIQFYSPSCSHCKKLQPIYTELAEQVSADPNMVVVKMNGVDNDVPLSYDVQG
uniref:protein disulfide-isomerase n=1 Tax=Cynoglossus semilaevis TaxID=244447 RepID=A0A3P8WVA1_CYNSE